MYRYNDIQMTGIDLLNVNKVFISIFNYRYNNNETEQNWTSKPT